VPDTLLTPGTVKIFLIFLGMGGRSPPASSSEEGEKDHDGDEDQDLSRRDAETGNRGTVRHGRAPGRGIREG